MSDKFLSVFLVGLIPIRNMGCHTRNLPDSVFLPNIMSVGNDSAW